MNLYRLLKNKSSKAHVLMCIQVIRQLIDYARTTLSKHPELTFQEVLPGA